MAKRVDKTALLGSNDVYLCVNCVNFAFFLQKNLIFMLNAINLEQLF